MHDNGTTHIGARVADQIEPPRHRVTVQADCQLVSRAIGVFNHALLMRLQCAGFTAETVALLELAPLIEIAWADGAVSERQRRLILQIGTREAIAKGTSAHDRLVAWLERRPSDEVFDVALVAIRAKLQSLEPEVHAMLHRRFFGDCTAVSLAADSALEDHKISSEEGRVLARILMALRPGRHVFDA
jgi:hypothetical protein